MNFDKWVYKNYLDLSHNYNSRAITTSFDEWCRFIHKGLEVGAWLPIEYTKNITRR